MGDSAVQECIIGKRTRCLINEGILHVGVALDEVPYLPLHTMLQTLIPYQ